MVAGVQAGITAEGLLGTFLLQRPSSFDGCLHTCVAALALMTHTPVCPILPTVSGVHCSVWVAMPLFCTLICP